MTCIDIGGIRVGDESRNTRIILRNEVSPDRLGRAVEGRALIGRWGTEEGSHVDAVLGAGEGVLVFVGRVLRGSEGVGEPIGGADEGGFGVEVL